MRIFTIHTAEEIAPLLKKLASEGYELIIGDVATCREAEELDISNLLLTSGEESLANAFDRAVALSEAFRRSTEQARLLQAIMQQAGERVVVLDAQERDALLPRQRFRNAGGEIIRMQVAGHGLRLKIKEFRKVAQLLLVAVQRFKVLKVANVLAREGVALI